MAVIHDVPHLDGGMVLGSADACRSCQRAQTSVARAERQTQAALGVCGRGVEELDAEIEGGLREGDFVRPLKV